MTVQDRSLLTALALETGAPPVGAVLWRARWRVIAAACLGAACGLAWALFLAIPLYTATTRLALPDSSTPALSVDIGSLMPRLSPSLARLNSTAAALRDPALIARLAHELPASQPDHHPPLMQTLLSHKWLVDHSPYLRARSLQSATARHTSSLSDQITIRALPDSHVLEITVTDATPARATLIADTLARLHLETLDTLRTQAADKHAAWLAAQLYAAQNSRRDTAAAAASYATSHDLLAPDPRLALISRRRAAQESHSALPAGSPRARRLLAEVATLTAEITAETTRRLHLSELQHAVTAADSQITHLLARAAAQAESAAITPLPLYQIAPATAESLPTAPRPAVATALGGFLSGLAAAALVLLFAPTPQHRRSSDTPQAPHAAPWQDRQ